MILKNETNTMMGELTPASCFNFLDSASQVELSCNQMLYLWNVNKERRFRILLEHPSPPLLLISNEMAGIEETGNVWLQSRNLFWERLTKFRLRERDNVFCSLLRKRIALLVPHGIRGFSVFSFHSTRENMVLFGTESTFRYIVHY